MSQVSHYFNLEETKKAKALSQAFIKEHTGSLRSEKIETLWWSLVYFTHFCAAVILRRQFFSIQNSNTLIMLVRMLLRPKIVHWAQKHEFEIPNFDQNW